MTLITLDSVSFSYDGRIVAEDITFNVDAGDYICVVGENGSGKSTLTKGLVGLKTPTSGKIEYAHGFTRKDIGYLPQQSQTQMDFPASVREVVLSGTGGMFYRSKDRTLADMNMSLLGIDDISKRCYRELSGGQKQRVLLARALCAAKKLLVLDEPAAGLDPLVTEEMYRLIRKINQERGCAVVMVSHDVESAVKNARTILHLQHRPVFFGGVEDYVNSPIYGAFAGSV